MPDDKDNQDPKTPALILDPEKYRHILADAGLTPEEEQEYLETVWAILLQAMLLGIRVEEEAENCGQLGESSAEPTARAPDAVQSKDSKCHSKFNAAADDLEAVEGSG